ncbi:hypothetical protein ETD86_15175 [Nonomuraea turkmeniaca]|uniref:Uncharacterized protein n=1 Tax=Nonomuraea turkmeniaca TaxID=103838 RepID=A0A5S4FLG1_9ACTN|nr:hypothetical protein [Nonomuraea turkmeniaca]TMR21512.1 hypothetical protein ETD86_15175 [Nonomuraea turkmeniaca]
MDPTRRRLLTGALATTALAACAPAPRATAPRPSASPRSAGRLLAATSSGLAVADLATGRVTAYAGALATPDASRLYYVTGRRLHTITPGSAEPSESWPVGEGGHVKAASGLSAVLGPPPGPRRNTTLTFAGARGVREVSLPGNVEPEAFSSDGTVMYFLDHLPPGAPDHYRVRMYDMAARETLPLLTRDKQPVPQGKEEEMRGQARQSVYGQRTLFTLYTHQPDHLHTRDLVSGRDGSPGVHAFVHVLKLDERWAYCLDLPAPFGVGPAAGHALALTGDHLYVFDATSGQLARASVTELSVVKTAALGAGPGGEAFAVAAGERLYLAVGRRLLALDGADLTTVADRPLPDAAKGVTTLGDRVLVGAGERVLEVDGSGTRVLATVPGLTAVRHAAA